MKLSDLVKKPGVYLDPEDLLIWGNYSAWIDDQGRVKVSLGSRESGKAFLHRLILSDCEFVDHINNNPSDNRKTNLRPATKSENLSNRGKTRLNTSGYKGVSLKRNTGKYVAQIQVNNKHIYLGVFKLKEEAAIIYNKAAEKYHGKFATFNEVFK